MPNLAAAATAGSRAPAPSAPPPAALMPAPPKREIAEALSFPASGRTIDRFFHAVLARTTLGISPASAMLTYLDWLAHLAIAPGKQTELAQKAWRKGLRFALWAARAATQPADGCCIEPLPQDSRFRGDDWRMPPFNLLYQGFLLHQQWWYNATTGVPGVTGQKEQALEFMARQLLDMWSPSNFVLTNPEILKATLAQGGFNLVRGAINFAEDWERTVAGRKPAGTESFVPGRDVALTPGKVIFRNRLMELIQYAPTTETVYAEPVLIVPACIMKYYILDLSPHNSMVKYLVDQGHSVFILSWKNPGAEDRDLSMSEYRRLGIQAALDVVRQVVPERQVHTVGYCLGGILLATEVAAMARDNRDGIATMTLFTTELDFSEPGEMQLFLDESQVSFLEDIMWDQGYLDGKQFAGAFQMLRSRDLIWSKMVREYLLGERQGMTDLMAWNADQTRSPYAMHSELLRNLFLNNYLAQGRYQVDGRPVVIADIRVPIFSVAASKDHIVPWQAVYKINLLTDTDVTFLLTMGGHNAGVVSEPGHRHRYYQVGTKIEGERYVDPDTWQATTPLREGSWWPEWQRWLAERSSARVPPPAIGAAEAGYAVLADAPGSYVFQE
jgi:polyhydroxyalkanoate synthase